MTTKFDREWFRGAWGGDDSVAIYRDDPDASVHERIEISVNCAGKVA